jgi:hypothetical protein
MHHALFTGTCRLLAALALTSLHLTSHAELNLKVPKDTVPAPTPASTQQPSLMNLEHNAQAPTGYQTSNKCQDGAHITSIQNINGTTYYKCERAASGPPVVRDAQRYERTPNSCIPGSTDPQCRSGSYRY